MMDAATFSGAVASILLKETMMFYYFDAALGTNMKPIILTVDRGVGEESNLYTVTVQHNDRAVAQEFTRNCYGCAGPQSDFRNKNKLTYLCSRGINHTFLIDMQ